jgi:hypothetical protein
MAANRYFDLPSNKKWGRQEGSLQKLEKNKLHFCTYKAK